MRSLKNSIYKLQEGFGYETYQAKAISVGKPELEFVIKGNKSKPDVYADGYLHVKWTNDGKREMEKKIKDVYGSEIDFVLSYKVNYNYEEFKNLSYIEVLAKCHPSIDITCYMFSDEKFDKYEETEKAYKILKPHLIDNKINDYIFNVIVYSKKYKEEYASFKGNSDKESDETLYEERLLINWLKVHNIEPTHHIKINSGNDLVRNLNIRSGILNVN